MIKRTMIECITGTVDTETQAIKQGYWDYETAVRVPPGKELVVKQITLLRLDDDHSELLTVVGLELRFINRPIFAASPFILISQVPHYLPLLHPVKLVGYQADFIYFVNSPASDSLLSITLQGDLYQSMEGTQ